MESEIVERLAKLSLKEQYPPLSIAYKDHPEAFQNNARWWLNAIADEMDAESDKGLPDSYELFRSVRWLRAQAGEE